MRSDPIPATRIGSPVLLLAALVATSAVAQTSTTTVSLNQGPAASTGSAATQSSTGSFFVSRYAGTKVLVGVTFSADSSTAVAFDSIFLQSISGVATLDGSYSLGGATVTGTSGNVTVNSGASSTLAYTTGSATITTNLGNFVGAGTFGGSATESFTVTGGGPQSTLRGDPPSHNATVTYTYTDQDHANGGFNSSAGGPNTLALNFGSFAAGSVVGNRSFSIFNQANTFPMDLFSITCSGNCTAFTLGGGLSVGGSVSSVDGGSSAPGSVAFNASATPGSYNASYSFSLRDSLTDDGANKSASIETLTLSVAATVTAVPEPDAMLLMLAGLGAMGLVVRRRS